MLVKIRFDCLLSVLSQAIGLVGLKILNINRFEASRSIKEYEWERRVWIVNEVEMGER